MSENEINSFRKFDRCVFCYTFPTCIWKEAAKSTVYCRIVILPDSLLIIFWNGPYFGKLMHVHANFHQSIYKLQRLPSLILSKTTVTDLENLRNHAYKFLKTYYFFCKIYKHVVWLLLTTGLGFFLNCNNGVTFWPVSYVFTILSFNLGFFL